MGEELKGGQRRANVRMRARARARDKEARLARKRQGRWKGGQHSNSGRKWQALKADANAKGKGQRAGADEQGLANKARVRGGEGRAMADRRRNRRPGRKQEQTSHVEDGAQTNGEAAKKMERRNADNDNVQKTRTPRNVQITDMSRHM